MAGSVLNSTPVLRLNFCAKLNICAYKSATSPSCKPLGAFHTIRIKVQYSLKVAPSVHRKVTPYFMIPFFSC